MQREANLRIYASLFPYIRRFASSTIASEASFWGDLYLFIPKPGNVIYIAPKDILLLISASEAFVKLNSSAQVSMLIEEDEIDGRSGNCSFLINK